MAGCKYSAAQAQHNAANLICMMIPDDVTDKKCPVKHGRASHGHAAVNEGNQARGGRWGSSGMNRVLSSKTRCVIASGGAGVPGTIVDGTPENT
jgi:hypothetical protein